MAAWPGPAWAPTNTTSRLTEPATGTDAREHALLRPATARELEAAQVNLGRLPSDDGTPADEGLAFGGFSNAPGRATRRPRLPIEVSAEDEVVAMHQLGLVGVAQRRLDLR